jgi:hypothetical protein
MLTNTQDESDGSFKQVGAKLFSKALSGTLKDDEEQAKVGLSAYVMISLLKTVAVFNSNTNLDNKISYGLRMEKINKGLEYLRKSFVNSKLNNYNLALILYAFKLARSINNQYKSMFLIDTLENELMKRSTKKGFCLFELFFTLKWFV